MSTCHTNPHNAVVEAGSEASANLPCYHKFRTAGGFYFYDFNTNGIVKVAREIYDHLGSFAYGANGDGMRPGPENGTPAPEAVREAIGQMRERGLLHRSPDEVVAPPYCEQCVEKMLIANVQMMCLELSQQCNLRCRYCAYSGNYADMRSHQSRFMSPETAFKAVDYYLEHSADIEQRVISFYGGEPLLNKDTLLRTFEYARAHPAAKSNLRFSVDTNGTLVTDELLDFFMKNEFIVQISLDGPQHVHDRSRVFRNGRGSWQRIDRLLNRIYDRDANFYENSVFIACTMAPPYPVWELDKFFSGERERNLNMMVNFVDEEGVDLAAIYPEEFAKGDLWKDLREYHANYLDLMCTGRRDEVTSVGRALYDRALIDVVSKANRKADGRISCNGICVPGMRKMFVDVDGHYYPCERVGQDFKIGHVDSGFDRAAIDSLIEDYRRMCEKKCHQCWAARMCRLCFASSRRDGGLSEARKNAECGYERTNLHNALTSVAMIMETSPQSLEWMKDVKLT
jgi:uncharacterized protein